MFRVLGGRVAPRVSLMARSFHSGGALMQCSNHGKDLDALLRQRVEKYLSEEDTKLAEEYPELKYSHPELADVLAGNKAWVEQMNEEDPEFFKRLAAGQDPKYLYLGCSDARVDPARLMGLDYGKLFIHRNVGNVVSSSDLNILTVIDFAINTLKIPHIVVCGHYDCGAVRGSIARPEQGGLGGVENWLRNIRDVARTHKDELFSIKDPEERHRRLVELNVVEQCLNVFKLGPVQRRRAATYEENENKFALPRIHGLVFDPANGLLEKLPLDFKKEAADLMEIYDLYQIPDLFKSAKPGTETGN